MAELRAPLESLLSDPLDSEREARLSRLIAAKRRHGSAPRRWRRSALVAFAAAALLLIGLGGVLTGVLRLGGGERTTSPGGPVLLAGGSARPGVLTSESASGREVSLSDGSSLHLEPGAQVSFERNDGREVAMSLVSGGLSVFVRPGGPRRWSIDADLVRVEVVGTRFRLDRGDDEVLVEVEGGRVRVEGPALRSGPIELGPGQSRRFRRPHASAAPAREPEQAAPEPPIEPSAPEATVAASPAPRRPEPWRALAAERRFAEAFDALSEQGHTRRTAAASSVEELLTLADIARLGGHPRRAVAPLERIIAEHSGDRRAAVAAFTLGRLRADVLGEPGRGAEAFRRVLALGPPAALRESAHARLVEACARSGDRAGASRAAREYLERYPSGRWAEDVRLWSSTAE